MEERETSVGGGVVEKKKKKKRWKQRSISRDVQRENECRTIPDDEIPVDWPRELRSVAVEVSTRSYIGCPVGGSSESTGVCM